MDFNFDLFKELMHHRVVNILIVSSPYDAYIMQEDGGILDNVFYSYRGLSLTTPPTFTKVRTAQEALKKVEKNKYDLIVINYPKYLGMDALTLGSKIKEIVEQTPVVLLAHGHRALPKRYTKKLPDKSIDKIFVWSGNRNLMWAIIKWVEDRLNVDRDIQTARVRVLILIEDSPYYYSSILPILYKSIVSQTQDIIDDSFNEEHQLWKLRARTKVLLAKDYEEGMDLYQKYRPHLIGVFSDASYFKEDKLNPEAGIHFLKHVREEMPHLPLLLLSSESQNKTKADIASLHFLDKNSPYLHHEIRNFMKNYMGFGDFVFRNPKGEELDRAHNLYSLEKKLETIPDISLLYHVSLNHFSNWLMARTEITLASKFLIAKHSDFENLEKVRQFLISSLKNHRIRMQKTNIAFFRPDGFTPDSDFLRIGNGSLGGKARGLAFISKYLFDNLKSFVEFKDVNISIPKTIVISTEAFDDFIDVNHLEGYAYSDHSDEDIAQIFKDSSLPTSLIHALTQYLKEVKTPIAVRSSSLLEDSKDTPYAGFYATYMLPNNQPALDDRMYQLSDAIKLIYASVFYCEPKAFAKTTQNRIEEEKMAIIIQSVVGKQYGDYFYPAVSGTAQSYNFYPLSPMRALNGIAQISIGLGKIVVEGGETLRFCPEYPNNLPQFSDVSSILKNSQKSFYALSMSNQKFDLNTDEAAYLVKRNIGDAVNERPVQYFSSRYDPSDHMIRDGHYPHLPPVITFARALKYNEIPLAKLIKKILQISRLGFGCDVEIEFSFNISESDDAPHEFTVLQVRPLTITQETGPVDIHKEDIKNCFCHSTNALGHGMINNISDIIFVKPETFNSKSSIEMVSDISKINSLLEKEKKPYLLVGPGRWGSRDHSLGIPVKWNDISGAHAIVEAKIPNLNADPSQGTHFFQNITSLGVIYFTIYGHEDFLNWDWFLKQNVVEETEYIKHISLKKPLSIIINGKKNHGIIKEYIETPISS